MGLNRTLAGEGVKMQAFSLSNWLKAFTGRLT